MKRLRYRIGAVLGGLLIVGVLLPALARPSAFRSALGCLALGWWTFLCRNLSWMEWDWGLIATGITCSLLVLLLGNWGLRALFSQVQPASHPNRPSRRWPWRWTIAIYLGTWLLFMVAFGAAGMWRHAAWLVASPEPWYQGQFETSPILDLLSVKAALEDLEMDSHHDLDATRKAFLAQSPFTVGGSPMAETVNVLFYGDLSNQIAAYLIIPRKAGLAEKGQFGARMPSGKFEIRPMTNLVATIAELDAAYPGPSKR